jgi:hypothetical protein
MPRACAGIFLIFTRGRLWPTQPEQLPLSALSENPVFFQAGDVRLEGMHFEAASPVAVAVICHPHPLFGGTMGNNVVAAVARELQETGHSTLRFNFRGVGQSEGSHGGGTAEVDDVRAAIKFVRESAGAEPPQVVLAGFSFGAWVAANALEGPEADDSVSHLILLGPPTVMFDFSILVKDTKERGRHFIVGENDEHCDFAALRDIFDKLPEPKTMAVIPRADHFLFARDRAIGDAVREAVADHI